MNGSNRYASEAAYRAELDRSPVPVAVTTVARTVRPVSGQVTAGTDPTMIDSSYSPVRVLTLKNTATSGGTSVYIGPASVTTAGGYILAPGEIVTWVLPEGDGLRLRELYAVVATGSGSLSFMGWA
jgi:hypothetical protein